MSTRPSSPSHRPARAFALSLSASLLALGAAAATFTACDRSDLIETLGQARPWDGSTGGGGDAGFVSVPFTVFSDDVGDKASVERRVLFKTRDAYAGFFGHGPPAAVDFAKDWVIFYAAGRKTSGGFAASVTVLGTRKIGNEKLLQAVTRLESPGAGCPVTDALTTPNVLIKFAAQTDVFNVDFARADTTRDCGGVPTNPCAAILCPPGTTCAVNKTQPPQAVCVPNPPEADPCSTVRCAAGTHCEAKQVVCVRAPCPPIAQCVKDAAVVRCGGFAGRPCPGRGRCDDDPSDSCDPANGGADCGGICTCIQNVACTTNTTFDSSPLVCACVPKK
jgi:hypothetical protein